MTENIEFGKTLNSYDDNTIGFLQRPETRDMTALPSTFHLLVQYLCSCYDMAHAFLSLSLSLSLSSLSLSRLFISFFHRP